MKLPHGRELLRPGLRRRLHEQQHDVLPCQRRRCAATCSRRLRCSPRCRVGVSASPACSSSSWSSRMFSASASTSRTCAQGCTTRTRADDASRGAVVSARSWCSPRVACVAGCAGPICLMGLAVMTVGTKPRKVHLKFVISYFVTRVLLRHRQHDGRALAPEGAAAAAAVPRGGPLGGGGCGGHARDV